MAPLSYLKARTSLLATCTSFLVVLAMMLSACGGTTTQPGSVSHNNGILTIVDAPKGDFSQNMNPFVDSQTSNYGTQGFMYETLLFVNQYTSDIKPWLASSYQTSADATHLTFTIRQGVKWSDGQPFTSDDVVFTLNLLKQYASKGLDRAGLWTTLIKDVSAPDPNTVVVNLLQPSSTAVWFIGGQTFIVPKHIWSTVSDPVTFTNPTPVVTGPFTLKSFASQLIVYDRNPHYWQPNLPAVREIRLPALDSNTSANLLLTRGDIDWAGVGYTVALDKVFVDKDPTHNHHWFPPSNVVTMYLNLTKYPFNLPAVRKAISFAIDRNQLTQKANPYAPPASPTGLILPSNQSFLSSDYNGSTFKVDNSQTDTLLQSAGFTKGSDGIYADKNGKKLTFGLNVVTGWDDWVSDCQIISSELNAIGMNVTVNATSFNAYLSALQMGTFDTAISWTDPGPTPYYLYNAMLRSTNSAPAGKAAATNFERWFDPSTDKLLDQYATTGDDATQKQALAGLQKIMVDQMPTIPLTYNPYWSEYRTSRWTNWPDDKNPYAAPRPTTYPDNEYVVLNLKPV